MDRYSDRFVWGDNWYIEDSKAWFIDGRSDVLCCLDLESKECKYVVELPNSNQDKLRVNPRCLKCDNEIFCMPDIGNSIWVYNIENKQFKQIEIENPNNERLWVTNFWKYGNKVFALSEGIKKIIEINIDKKTIDNYYTICNIAEEKIAKSVRVELDIYCVSASSNQIYQFNLESKKTVVHTIPNVSGGLHTINFYEGKFWLSGYRKEIYVWDKEKNHTKILSDFPEQFGIYNLEKILGSEIIAFETPVFSDIVFIGKYIWCIPYLSNNILYINKDTNDIHTLEVENEEETKESLTCASRVLTLKFLLEYIRENRYIGLFSLKNGYVVEIDAVEKTAYKKIYTFDKKSQLLLIKRYHVDVYHLNIYYENNSRDKEFFEMILMGLDLEKKEKVENNVGQKIYKIIENTTMDNL